MCVASFLYYRETCTVKQKIGDPVSYIDIAKVESVDRREHKTRVTILP